MNDENTSSKSEAAEIPSTASQPPSSDKIQIEDICDKVANKVLASLNVSLNAIKDAIKARYEQVDRLNDEKKRELETELERHKKTYSLLLDETIKYRMKSDNLNEEVEALNKEVEALKCDKRRLEESARKDFEEAYEAKKTLEAERKAFDDERRRLEEKRKRDIATMEQTVSTDQSNCEAEKNAMVAKHKAEIEEIRQKYESALAKKDKDWQRKLAEKNEELEANCETTTNEYEEKLDVVRAEIEKRMPKEVRDLFGYREDADDSEDSRRRLQCAYSFMWLLSGSFDKDVFVKRFRAFDTAFADAMDSDRDTLEECRRRVERYLNSKMAGERDDCTISVSWPKKGEDFDKEIHEGNENARRITYARSAYIMCQTKDGNTECLSRAGVDAE